MTTSEVDRVPAPAGARRTRRRVVLVAAPVVAVVALWVLSTVGTAIRTSPPGPLSWQPGQRHLVTDPDSSDYSELVLVEGTLAQVAPGRDPACLVVTGRPNGQVVLIWPRGYRLSPSGEVLRADGSVAARVGDHVRLSGGPWGGGAVPGDACPPGDRWVVDP